MSLPVLSEPWILGTALASLALVTAIGIWSWRRTRSARDFFIAGQGVGLWATAMATMSAAFSGFVFLGGPGLTYRMGIGSLFIVLPVGFTAGLICWTLAKRLRLLAEVREVYTIPDAVACRFDNRGTTALAIVAIVIGTVGYLGSQLLALAILFEALFDTRRLLGIWSLPTALLLGLTVVVLYSVLGGMLAGVYTDLVQGVLMLAAALLVFWRALTVGGGLSAMVVSIADSDRFSGFFDPLGGVPAITALGFFFVFGIGVLGQPHMLHKFYMMKDPRQLRWMPLILAGSQAMCLLIWIGIGIAVPALVAQGRMIPLLLADDAAPRFLLGFVPPALTGLVVAGILAAVMSTADSFLNIGAAAVIRDIPRLLLRRPVKKELTWGRWATVAVALAAAALALTYGDLIALLGTFAFGTLGAALAPTLALGLNWKRVTAAAASASIATGLGVTLLLEMLQSRLFSATLGNWVMATGALPAAVALAASLTVLLVLSWLTGRRTEDKLSADMVAVMER